MEYNLPLNSPINLDVLDDYLMSDRAPDDSMGLSDLDGFLTGVVVGPELIMPSEWLPVIWGGAEPQFETQDEMRIVLGTIMGRYNEIAACFASDPEEFDPIFWEGPEGEVIASDWAGGFLDAVALRAQAWKPLIEDDRARILMAPLFLLNGDIELDDGAAARMNYRRRHRICSRPASRAFMRFGGIIRKPSYGRGRAGQEAAGVSDPMTGIDRRHGGQSHRQGRRRLLRKQRASLPKAGVGCAEAAGPTACGDGRCSPKMRSGRLTAGPTSRRRCVDDSCGKERWASLILQWVMRSLMRLALCPRRQNHLPGSTAKSRGEPLHMPPMP